MIRRTLPLLGILLVMMAAMAIVGCNGRKASPAEEWLDSLSDVPDDSIVSDDYLADDGYIPRAADDYFDDFFFLFSRSLNAQTSRIKFPLLVVTDGKTDTIDQKHWHMERFFMEQGYYTLILDNREQLELMKDTTLSHAVVEKIDLINKRVRQFVFDRLNGCWVMTQLNNCALEDIHHAAFLAFYERFATDNDFQMRSLNSSLQFSGPDADDDFNTITGQIDASQWSAFKPSLIPHGVIYNITYGKPAKEGKDKIFLIRGIANGLEMDMHFSLKHGEWKLMKFTN